MANNISLVGYGIGRPALRHMLWAAKSANSFALGSNTPCSSPSRGPTGARACDRPVRSHTPTTPSHGTQCSAPPQTQAAGHHTFAATSVAHWRPRPRTLLSTASVQRMRLTTTATVATATTPYAPRHAYALGSEERELVRLGIQHGVFSAQSRALYRRMNISLGESVIDLGCGPSTSHSYTAPLFKKQHRIWI